MTLGVIFLTSFVIAFGMRIPLERSLVEAVDILRRPKRQFLVDGALCLAVGVGVMLYNRYVFHFPVVNGLVVVLGCAMAGFFISTDMALARERLAIKDALNRQQVLPPPARLYPMSRKFSIIALSMALFVTIVVGMVVSQDVAWLREVENSPQAAAQAGMSVMYEIFFIMAVLLIWVTNLIFSYSSNLNLLFTSETSVLKRVSRGDFSRWVPVATNDEFGFIAGHTNRMIEGLKHRIELISSLKLAEEVQQNLLPQDAPDFAGLDIDGQSLYCDETGGDYFDYFPLAQDRMAIVVADASGHGVGAALHMTTARAFLRSGIQNYQGPARLLDSVNRFLTRDSFETGRFTAIFLLEIDIGQKALRWVRAGHDPAVFYDAQEDRFLELSGQGMALGVDITHRYAQNRRLGWSAGSIIVISTDGIREARNPTGEMFGMSRCQEIIRQHAGSSAKEIKTAILEALDAFRNGAPQEDDITLVVVKL